jgi:Family of unknown function (DUF6338)
MTFIPSDATISQSKLGPSMDFAFAQLALIFLPGIIWANIDAKYGAGLKPDQSTLLLRAFMFGLATYTAIFVLYVVFNKEFGYPVPAITQDTIDILELKDEIAWSIPLSFVLSILWLFAVRHRFLKRFLHYIGATRRYGDEDVWSYTLNSNDANVEYVHVRDISNGFIFAGWVNTYSENEDFRELLLSDVIVYLSDGTEVSRPPVLYISRPKDNIWVEFPYRKEGYADV